MRAREAQEIRRAFRQVKAQTVEMASAILRLIMALAAVVALLP
jgi:hypothetical protein